MSVWSIRLALVLAGTLIGACEKTCTLHVPLKESKGALLYVPCYGYLAGLLEQLIRNELPGGGVEIKSDILS